MAWSHNFHCDTCNRRASVLTGVISYYYLDDGLELPCSDQLAWCNNCDDVVAAERLPDPHALNRLVAHLTAEGLDEDRLKTAKLLKKEPAEYLNEFIDTYRAMIAWRRDRISPPRCLSCGSVEIVELEPIRSVPLEKFSHPQCGGQFFLDASGHASEAYFRRLTPEGLNLETTNAK